MRGRKREREKQGSRVRFQRGISDKEGREKFREKLGNVEKFGEDMKTEKREMEKRIKTIKETEMKIGGIKNRERGDWNKECGRNREEERS